jgi:ABC-type branched-subunit amino acid transport system ATPase component
LVDQGTPVLEARNVTFSYGSVQVLFGVDIEVHQGEAVALLGTNGAGKSTVLRNISGLSVPSNGAVFFQGRDVTKIPAERRVRLGITHVPGGRSVFPSLSVLENLRTSAYFINNRRKVEEGIDRVFASFPELADRQSQRAGTLSGGQQQMLAIGRALLTKPVLLMVDELSLGLAPVVVERLAGFVRELQQQGVSLLLVEQSVNVALSVCDRAYFLERGRVRFSGPTADLLDRPDILRSVFLSHARSALAPGHEGRGDDRTAGGAR